MACHPSPQNDNEEIEKNLTLLVDVKIDKKIFFAETFKASGIFNQYSSLCYNQNNLHISLK